MEIKLLLDLLVAKLHRTQNNKWVFSSFNGDYSDSPRALSEKLHEKNPDVEIVWILKNNAQNIPEYIKRVRPNSREAEIERHQANVVIDNVYADQGNGITNSRINQIKWKIMLLLRRNPHQHVYTTWHGIPLKRLGIDEVGGRYRHFICNKMKMFVNSSYENDIMRGVTQGKIEIISLGMPRNDVLFQPKDIEKLKKLGIDENVKVMLYAPSFRAADTVSDIATLAMQQIKSIDVKNLLHAAAERFGGTWKLICRFHQHVSSAIDWEHINNEFNGHVINGNILSDMADYLPLVNLLITDVSSCMFDFALTHKPCFIYFPDLDEYEQRERGFYLPIRSLPFPVSCNTGELINTIETFDESNYLAEVNEMINTMGIVDDGNSASRIIEYILKEIDKR